MIRSVALWGVAGTPKHGTPPNLPSLLSNPVIIWGFRSLYTLLACNLWSGTDQGGGQPADLCSPFLPIVITASGEAQGMLPCQRLLGSSGLCFWPSGVGGGALRLVVAAVGHMPVSMARAAALAHAWALANLHPLAPAGV